MTTIVMLVLAGAFVLTGLAYFAGTTDVVLDPAQRAGPPSSSSLIAGLASTTAGRRIHWR